jgi:hypothetical protein
LSLLSLINHTRLRTNQSSITVAFASTDTGVQQMIALLRDIGDELAERVQWQALNISGTIAGDGSTTIWPFTAGTLIGADFNSDFAISTQTTSPDFGGGPATPAPDFGGLSNGLRFVSSLFPLQPLVGPVTNEQMNELKAFPVGILRPVWRVIDDAFEFWPALAAGELATYNYYSTYWIQTAAGVRGLDWTSDADYSLIDEKILASGLEWRWLAAKGLDYAEAFRRYERRIDRADGRQDTRREVNMSNRRVGNNSTWPGAIPLYDGSGDNSTDFGYS